MVNFRFLAALSISMLIFLFGIFLGQIISQYNLSELRQAQENIFLDIIGYELSYSILSKSDICKTNFTALQTERAKLGQLVASLEERFGQKHPEVLTQKERYQVYQIREYMFFRELKEKCNRSLPLILYFYSKDCNELCIAQGYILDSLYEKYGLTTIYAIDYEIDNPSVRIINKMYNITSVPSLVINEKKYEGIRRLGELEEIIYE